MEMNSRLKILAYSAFLFLAPVSLWAQDAAPAPAPKAAAAKKRPVKFEVYKYETSKLLPNAVIEVDNPWGDIRLRSHRKPMVKVEGAVQRIGDDAPSPVFTPSESAEMFKFSVDVPEGILEPRSNRVDLVIYLPKDLLAKVKTKDGTIEAKKTIGTIEAETETGKIVITHHGKVTATSQDGPIQVQPMYSGWGEIKVKTGKGGATAFLPDGDNFKIDVQGATEINSEFEMEGELPGPLKLRRGLESDTISIEVAGPVKVLKTVIPSRERKSMYGTLNREFAKQKRESATQQEDTEKQDDEAQEDDDSN